MTGIFKLSVRLMRTVAPALLKAYVIENQTFTALHNNVFQSRHFCDDPGFGKGTFPSPTPFVEKYSQESDHDRPRMVPFSFTISRSKISVSHQTTLINYSLAKQAGFPSWLMTDVVLSNFNISP
eukprot:scaffold14134_cov70-Cylindrotheca_fusiformis.AAC.2